MFRTISNDLYAATGVFRLSASGAFSQSAISFAPLPDGGFLAVWSDVFFTTSSIRAQRFDSNGHKVGAEFLVTDNGIQSDVTLLSSGNFLITWVTENAFPDSFDIKARIYDATGAPVGAEFFVNTTVLGFQTEPTVSALTGGGFAIAWLQHENSSFDHIRVQVFAADGSSVGGETIASDAQAGDKLLPRILGLEGGGFVVGWYSFSAESGPEGGPGSRAQLFDALGNKVGSPFAVNAPTSGSQQLGDWAALPGGGFIATWSDDGGPFTQNPHPENRGIWFQIFDANGAKVGSQILASASGVSVQVPVIELLPDGFVIVWRDNSGTADNPNAHIRGQAFDLAGNKVGAEFAVTQGLNSSQHIPDIAGFGSGAFVVGWNNEDGPQFNDADVRAQLFFPVTHGSALADIFAGTPGRDFYIGHDGDDQISGQGDDDGLAGSGGNDILSGGDGNDDMDGGEGADTLTGGAGNDLLDGGAGDDSLTGGTGDDRYVVREAGDQVVEAAGEGLDTIVTSLADYSLPDNFENLTGDVAASAQQTLRGNPLSNILTGAGQDTFYVGQGGTDVVHGGAGQDVLWILWSDSTEDVTTDPYRHGSITLAGLDGGFTNGAAGSVTFNSIEVLNVWTGSGDDVIEMGGNGGQHDLRAGAGNDLVNIARGVAFADGGEGNDGVEADYSQVEAAVLWDLNAVGGHQGIRGTIVNFEYFSHLFTWSFDDIITTTALALDDMIWTWYGDDQIVVRNGHDFVDASFGSDLLTVEWGGLGGNVTMINPLHSEFSGGWSGRMGTAEYSVRFVKVDIFHVTTGSGDDNLVGGGGDDRFTTGAGNDRLDGGAGADLLTGGAGNDVYVVGEGDTIVEAAGEGVDEIRTSLGSKTAPDYALFVLPDFVEKLTGTSAGAQGVRGNALDNVIVMGAGADLVVLDDGGIDSVNGGGGNDFFYYGATLTGADITNGGAGTDTVGLLGNYSGGNAIIFTAANLVGVERLALYTGGGTAGYAITISDSNAAAGTEFFVTAASLMAAETLVFNGSDETNARLTVLGGGGGDTLVGGQSSDYLAGNAGNDSLYGLNGIDFILGGAGADQLRGGAGADHFRYAATTDSMTGSVDQILDFQHIDRIDLSAIDANANAGDGDTAFTFIGANAFTNSAGQLRATEAGGVWTVEGDTNGDGTADLVISVTKVEPGPLAGADFLL